MATITALTTFLDDRDRYVEGETYEVEDGLAGYFGRLGWARVEGVEALVAPQDVTLDIDSSRTAHGAEKVNG